MNELNFQYGNEYASDYQLVICTFGSNEQEAVGGSQFSANQVKIVGTDEFVIINTDYDGGLRFAFQTCKMIDCDMAGEVTPEEYSKINRWVNRKEPHKLKFSSSGYENIYFLGTFNIRPIKIAGIIRGIEFSFISNYPYGFQDEIIQEFSGKEFMIYNHSDEIGELLPYVVITCNEAGTLTITNDMDNEIFELKKCVKGEIITLDCQHRVITSTAKSHLLYDTFNFNYLKLVNTYEERKNNFTSSLNINMEVRYSPIRKVGV